MSSIDDYFVDIVTSEDFLRMPCERVDLQEGEEIAAKLFRVLNIKKSAYGLAANQIGIRKRVCVVNVNKPIYLINPQIIDASGEIIFYESCLSFPDKIVKTKRFSKITVVADNLNSPMDFDLGKFDTTNILNNLDAIEIVAIQHEISHLDGKTIFDYEYKLVPIKNKSKYSRNEKILISNGIENIIIKYKNFSDFEKKGYKIINEKNTN